MGHVSTLGTVSTFEVIISAGEAISIWLISAGWDSEDGVTFVTTKNYLERNHTVITVKNVSIGNKEDGVLLFVGFLENTLLESC